MNKKAESISMSVIIIAAIALLVLVILAVLVLRAGNSIGDGTGCQGLSGTCADECSELEGGIYTVDISKSGRSGGCAEEEKCCVLVTSLSGE